MIEIDFRPDEKTLRQFGWIALGGFGLLATLMNPTGPAQHLSGPRGWDPVFKKLPKPCRGADPREAPSAWLWQFF